MRLFYASDLHGSEPCFRKFINAARYYDAQALILGGDLAGKAVLPIVEQRHGVYRTRFFGRDIILESLDSLMDLEKKARAIGFYPCRLSPERAQKLADDPDALDSAFAAAVTEFFENWLAFAEQHLPQGVECYVIAGNDDFPSVIEALRTGSRVQYVEGQKVVIGGEFEMISVGYSNRTPFNSPREVDDEDLGRMVSDLAEQIGSRQKAIFNVHCPPYGTVLDMAPEIDEQLNVKMSLGQMQMMHVGSKAVRKAVEDYQPMLGLHGHCHESRGMERIGRTLCLNPGSEYSNGVLRGAIINISGKDPVVRHQFVSA
jgi:Icc-related predicted phosphoesterase